MEYKFNKHYLQSLEKDARLKFKDGIVTKSDYELLKSIIHNLMHGDKVHNGNLRTINIDIIKIDFNILKEEIGMDTIENILNIAEEFLKNSSKQKITYKTYKQTSDNIVNKVLNFYGKCNAEYSKRLNDFIYSPYSQLEIISENVFNQGKYRSIIQVIPIYNLEFIRIVKENILYDEAKLCHELRHELDIQKLTRNSMDLNSLAEVNPIATELFYQITKLDENC